MHMLTCVAVSNPLKRLQREWRVVLARMVRRTRYKLTPASEGLGRGPPSVEQRRSRLLERRRNRRQPSHAAKMGALCVEGGCGGGGGGSMWFMPLASVPAYLDE